VNRLQRLTSNFKLFFIAFLLIAFSHATLAVAAGQWDGVWAGQLDVGNCNWNMPFAAEVKNGVFRAESDVMTTGLQFRRDLQIRSHAIIISGRGRP
jgi:hypothetical protein